jgi:malate synthase
LSLLTFSKHSAKTDNGTTITAEYIDKILNEEAKKVKGVDAGNLETARKYMSQQVSVAQSSTVDLR